MPHTEEPFYKMKIGWAADPKVASLGRFGALDACLARDLFSQMIGYSRGELTDGLVPAELVGLVAYPLPPDDADRIVRELAHHGPHGPLCDWDADRNAWRILAYGKWNDTAEEVHARRASGRNAALHRWKGADRNADRNADRTADGITGGNAGGIADRTSPQVDAGRNAEGIHRARAQVDTEVEVEVDNPRAEVGDRDSRARAREASPDDDQDDEELTQVQALMAAAGRPVGREDASKILAAVLAKAGARVRNRRAFIGKVLGDRKQARAYASGAGQTQTAKEIIAQSHRPGGPSEHVADHAEEARQRLAARERPTVERGDDPARGLWGEELARAQLAEARAARGVIDPEPAADPEAPVEPGGEPEADDESAADDEPEEGGDDEYPF